MVKRLFTLTLMLVAIVATASARYGLGDQKAYNELKDGDKIILGNAMCKVGRYPYHATYGGSYTGNENPGEFQFLKNVTAYTNNSLTVTVPTIEEGFDPFVYILEAAEENDPQTGNARFYLKNEATGQYVTGTTTATTSSALTENKEEALPFEIEPGTLTNRGLNPSLGSGWAFTPANYNDLSLSFTYRWDETEANKRYFGPFWNYGYAYFGNATDINIWNVYEAKEDADEVDDLYLLRASYAKDATFYRYHSGEEVGSYDEDAVNNFIAEWDEAGYIWSENPSADAAKAESERLQAAYEAAMKTVPFEDGFYHIVSAYPAYEAQQNVKKAMAATSNYSLVWRNYDREDAFQLFKITTTGDGEYSIQNWTTQEYINTVEGTSQQIPTSPDPTTPQTITPLLKGTAQFKIANTANTQSYHTAGHESGAGVEGTVVTWEAAYNSASAWYLVKETDQELIDRLSEGAAKKVVAEKLANVLSEANSYREKIVENKPLITSPDQFSANSVDYPSSYSDPFVHLIDGQYHYSHCFHSRWSQNEMANPSTTAEEWEASNAAWVEANPNNQATGVGYHNLQVRFNEPVDNFYFKITGRTGTTYVDTPTELDIYVTNDDELGASTDQADLDKWTFVNTIAEGLPGNVAGAVYTSEEFQLDQPYKYVRFVVKNTGMVGQNARFFEAPEVTGITWNVGGWQLYQNEIDDNSEYVLVEGMKEAIDALDPLLQAAPEKIRSLSATEEDVDALAEALEKVKAIFIDRDALDSELASAVTAARNAYNKVTERRVTLITSASQFSSNNVDAPNSYAFNANGGNMSAFEHLLYEDNLHYYFNLHSYWDNALMTQSGTTAEQWAAKLEEWKNGNSNNIAVGIGYHHLQVALNAPTDNFYIYMRGRTSTAYIDTPNDLDIYATNDDELGAGVDMADIDQWDHIVRMNEENGYTMPVYPSSTSDSPVWTSDVVKMDKPYKYLRFVVMGNVDEAQGRRTYAQPEITGKTYNVAVFRLFQDRDEEGMQVNYDQDFHQALEELQALADEDYDYASGYKYHHQIDNTKATELQAKVEALLAAYADPDVLSKANNKYTSYANNATAGDEVGQVANQDAVDTYKATIEEIQSGLSKPTRQEQDEAIAKMETALQTLLGSVNTIEPMKWYNFQNKSKDLPLYSTYTIGSTASYGARSWGENDPYSMWRLVPVEDGKYALQNLYSGHYYGKQENGTYTMNNVKVPVNVVYLADGTVALDLGEDEAVSSASANATVGIAEVAHNSGSAWIPVEVTAEDMVVNITDNYIRTALYPYEIGDITLANENAKAYGIQSVSYDEETNTTTLNLYLKDDVKAGEPFIIEVGDYTLYADEQSHTSSPFVLPITDELVAEGTSENGLIGVMDGITLPGAGYGTFASNGLQITTGETNVVAMRAYIQGSEIETQIDKNIDQVVVAEGKLDGVALGLKNIKVLNASDKVDVYSVDGKLIKKNVKATEARKGLTKGLYIIGKEKVAVK